MIQKFHKAASQRMLEMPNKERSAPLLIRNQFLACAGWRYVKQAGEPHQALYSWMTADKQSNTACWFLSLCHSWLLSAAVSKLARNQTPSVTHARVYVLQ